MDTHSLGLYLREAREAQELTLDDAVQTLKIRRGTLEAFEHGDFASVAASPVQLKGFLRNYAAYLALDDDLVLQYYESATDPRRSRGRRRRRERAERSVNALSNGAQAAIPSSGEAGETRSDRRETIAERRESRRRRRSRMANLVIGSFVVLLSFAVIAVVAFQFLQEQDDNLLPESVAVRATRTNLPTLAPTFTLSPRMAALPQFQQDFDGRGVALTVQTQQRTWMRVLVDGIEQVAQIIAPGEVLNFRADREIVLHAANGGGLIVFYNGNIQGSYGPRGQEVKVEYLPDRVNIVTANLPEPTPEATNTTVPTLDVTSSVPIPTADETPTAVVTDVPVMTNTSGQPTPTLLPGAGEAAGPEALEGTDSVEAPAAAQAQSEPTIAPTQTPTPLVPTEVLPPRITPDNPTPTKSAP